MTDEEPKSEFQWEATANTLMASIEDQQREGKISTAVALIFIQLLRLIMEMYLSSNETASRLNKQFTEMAKLLEVKP